MKTALVVQSLTGNTWHAAELIAGKLQQEGHSITGLSPVKAPDLESLHQADVVLVGTWTHGLFVVGQAPWNELEIANLPTLRGKQTAGFLTYALNPGKAVRKLDHAVRATGGRNLGAVDLHRKHLDEHTDIFVDRLLANLEAPERITNTI